MVGSTHGRVLEVACCCNRRVLGGQEVGQRLVKRHGCRQQDFLWNFKHGQALEQSSDRSCLYLVNVLLTLTPPWLPHLHADLFVQPFICVVIYHFKALSNPSSGLILAGVIQPLPSMTIPDGLTDESQVLPSNIPQDSFTGSCNDLLLHSFPFILMDDPQFLPHNIPMNSHIV